MAESDNKFKKYFDQFYLYTKQFHCVSVKVLEFKKKVN